MHDAALVHDVITMSGSISQPRALIFSINGLYLLALASNVYGKNLSLQYVNLMNCMVRVWSIFVRGSLWYGNPLTQRMSSLNRELQWHLWVPHV